MPRELVLTAPGLLVFQPTGGGSSFFGSTWTTSLPTGTRASRRPRFMFPSDGLFQKRYAARQSDP